jgi:hypothetical protein
VSPGWLQIVRGVPDFIIVEWKFNPSKTKEVVSAPSRDANSFENKVLRLFFSLSLSRAHLIPAAAFTILPALRIPRLASRLILAARGQTSDTTTKKN